MTQANSCSTVALLATAWSLNSKGLGSARRREVTVVWTMVVGTGRGVVRFRVHFKG